MDYATSDGTAMVGVDSTATSGTLTFGVGEQSTTITIPILNDGLREPDETFQLKLSQVNGGAGLGQPSTASIQILDNDPGARLNQYYYVVSIGDEVEWPERAASQHFHPPVTVSTGISARLSLSNAVGQCGFKARVLVSLGIVPVGRGRRDPR